MGLLNTARYRRVVVSAAAPAGEGVGSSVAAAAYIVTLSPTGTAVSPCTCLAGLPSNCIRLMPTTSDESKT